MEQLPRYTPTYRAGYVIYRSWPYCISKSDSLPDLSDPVFIVHLPVVPFAPPQKKQEPGPLFSSPGPTTKTKP